MRLQLLFIFYILRLGMSHFPCFFFYNNDIIGKRLYFIAMGNLPLKLKHIKPEILLTEPQNYTFLVLLSFYPIIDQAIARLYLKL
ncbi:hypothetical protein CKF58_02385 [Psittacicella hinzii]|uniref:Uncharacterized protein n=1 Tax=Psittacicella hinzii TaxID=2028575 RepID=A0A3A1YQ26_9GAMM|nr:hypothetical protein CKF58_02385 [Psittacicella hinzii]